MNCCCVFFLAAVRGYTNPLHLHVVDRYLRQMGDKRFWASFGIVLSPWIPCIDSPQSRCCGSYVSFTDKNVFSRYQRDTACLTFLVQIRKSCLVARTIVTKDGYLCCKIIYAVHQDSSPITMKIQQTQSHRCRSTTLCCGFFATCIHICL